MTCRWTASPSLPGIIALSFPSGRQILTGVVLGVGATVTFNQLLGGDLLHGLGGPLLSVMVVVMIMVGLMAAMEPARRGLRIAPTEALKGE